MAGGGRPDRCPGCGVPGEVGGGGAEGLGGVLGRGGRLAPPGGQVKRWARRLTTEPTAVWVTRPRGPCPRRDSRSGQKSGAGVVRRRAVAESFPILHELAAQLADAGGAQAVLLRNVQRPLPAHQVVDQATVAFGPAVAPQREVAAELD